MLSVEAVSDLTEDHELLAFKSQLLSYQFTVIVIVVSDVAAPPFVFPDAVSHAAACVVGYVAGRDVRVTSIKERIIGRV